MRMTPLAALAWILLLSPPARPQGTTMPACLEPGAPLTLLANHPPVQKEVNATSNQLAQVKALRQKVLDDVSHAAAVPKVMGKTLAPDQLKRLREISLQVREGWALHDEDVAEALRLSPQQRDEIGVLYARASRELQDDLKRLRFRTEAERMAYIIQHHRKAGEGMLKVLTDQQREAFKRLQGKEFDHAKLFQ